MSGGNAELIAKLDAWAAAYEAGEADRAAGAESLTDYAGTLREAIAALSAQPRPVPEWLIGLHGLADSWRAGVAGKPGVRTFQTFDDRGRRLEDEYDNEVSATRRCSSELDAALERIAGQPQPASAPAGVEAGWYRYNKSRARWEDTTFGTWLDPAVYGPPREQHGYSLEVAAGAQSTTEPAAKYNRDDNHDAQKPAPEAPVGVGEALRIAYRHLDMESMRVSHCNDAAAIDAALAQQETRHD